MADPLDFQKGTLDLMILKTLSWGPSHGYGIARWLDKCTDGAISVGDSALYPALARLEERGFVTSEWGVTSTGREAKFYTITARGKKHLVTAHDQWGRFAAALAAVFASKPAPT